MSGEKRAMDKASWEFTVDLLGGILIALFGTQAGWPSAGGKPFVFTPAHSIRSLWEHENSHSCIIII